MSKISLEDRLTHGNLTITEVCVLRPVSRAGFYNDKKRGLVAVKKVGTRALVPGPIAARYLAGVPIDDLVSSMPGLEVG